MPFHVVSLNAPFLLCIQDMKRMGVILDNLRNFLIQGTKIIPIVMKFGHPWMLLYNIEQSIAYCHLTESELRQLHRRFGHPSVRRLFEVLRRTGHHVENDTLQQIIQYCRQCQLHGKAPGRFKFKLPKEFEFNHTVIVDILNLDGNNTLHAIDEATAFQGGRFLSDMSAKTVWNALRAC